jgi:hypothetical protein
MEDNRSTINEKIYFYGGTIDDEPIEIDSVEIEWDLNDEGRWVCLE